MELKNKRIVYLILSISVLAILYALKNTSYFARSSAFVASFVVFYFSDIIFKCKFKNIHYLIFFVASTFGILFSPLYYMFSIYDKVLHFITPFLICILAYAALEYRLKDVSLRMKLCIIVCVAVTLISFWELLEFSLDKLYNTQLQGVWVRDVTGMEKVKLIMDRNDDTMIDMTFGVLGSLFFVVVRTGLYFYKKFLVYKKMDQRFIH